MSIIRYHQGWFICSPGHGSRIACMRPQPWLVMIVIAAVYTHLMLATCKDEESLSYVGWGGESTIQYCCVFVFSYFVFLNARDMRVVIKAILL